MVQCVLLNFKPLFELISESDVHENCTQEAAEYDNDRRWRQFVNRTLVRIKGVVTKGFFSKEPDQEKLADDEESLLPNHAYP